MTDKIKDELGDYFKNLSEKYNMDEESVEKEFDKLYEAVSKSPSMSAKSDAKRVKRTKAQMAAFFSNQRKSGKTFVFIPLGNNSSPKDWNGKEIKEILAKAKAGRLLELLTADKILYKNTPAGKVPVKSVKEWGKRTVYIKNSNVYLKEVDDSEETTEWYVVDGEELRSGELNIIPRDNRIYTSDSKEHVNFRWSRELIPNYTTTVWGFGYPKDDDTNVRMCRFNIRNEQANPMSNDYFFKKYPAFRLYETEFAVNDNKGFFDLSYSGPLNPRNATITGVDDNNIDDVIEQNLDDIREKYAREGVNCFVPPIIYIDGVEEFHKSCCKRDEVTGKAKKSAKGWDLTEFGKFAVMLADFEKGKYQTEDPEKGNYYLFSDGDSDKKLGGFGDKTQYNMAPIQPSTPIIACITTTRGPSKYNYKTGKSVPDAENGDISINVNVMRTLPRVEIEFDEEETYEE